MKPTQLIFRSIEGQGQLKGQGHVADSAPPTPLPMSPLTIPIDSPDAMFEETRSFRFPEVDESSSGAASKMAASPFPVAHREANSSATATKMDTSSIVPHHSDVSRDIIELLTPAVTCPRPLTPRIVTRPSSYCLPRPVAVRQGPVDTSTNNVRFPRVVMIRVIDHPKNAT